jgi:hypothetical protein
MEYKGFFFHISTAQSPNWKVWEFNGNSIWYSARRKKGVTELKGLEKGK